MPQEYIVVIDRILKVGIDIILLYYAIKYICKFIKSKGKNFFNSLR